MKFEEIAKGKASIPFKGDEMFACTSEGSCSICNSPTVWISISFQGFYCSEECNLEEWDNFFEACNKDTSTYTQ